MKIPLRPQRTLLRPVSLHGRGYWSSREIRVEFRPAPPHTGLVFVRRDLSPVERIPAKIDLRVEMPRRTALSSGRAGVEMVEHVLAALAGMRIDNCEVWVDAPEMPANDGSCRDAVEALISAGIQVQAARKPVLEPCEPIHIEDGEQSISYFPQWNGRLSVEYHLDYGEESAVGQQTLVMDIMPVTFRRELAPARTFLLESEAKWLQAQGLGRDVTYQELLVFGSGGPIDNELRYADECVRHKVLDMVGDLALAGCDIRGRIVAHRSGHRLNAELVRAILESQTLECVAK
ncbi:MAG: UDP-3-O-acyl-N-acetylglucosamine deacetylase [Planctomycetales bacterium]|nr:UDP-3-O-acyl-N-acetylglucosamine deacetylase [Planctomycetales bacterium]